MRVEVLSPSLAPAPTHHTPVSRIHQILPTSGPLHMQSPPPPPPLAPESALGLSEPGVAGEERRISLCQCLLGSPSLMGDTGTETVTLSTIKRITTVIVRAAIYLALTVGQAWPSMLCTHRLVTCSQ